MAARTALASMLLVPSPLPDGIALSSVRSMPQPNVYT